LPENKREGLQNLKDSWDVDPRNPRNWSFRQKWTAVAVVSMYSLVAPLSSSMMAPGLPGIAEKYSIESVTILSMSLSIFLLTFALGPLILAPLSEMYGRTWILHIGNLFTVAFNIGCAFAPNTGSLLGFRLLTGLASSAPVACGGGSIRMCDLFSERDRASAMAIYTLGPLIGPVIGPIGGGFIAQTVGVKYIFITIAGKETYAPVIRHRIAARSGDSEKVDGLDADLLQARGDKLYFLWINLIRPVTILFRSLICFILSLYMSFMYGIYYLLFATFASSYCSLDIRNSHEMILDFFKETYGFGQGIGGLAYIGLGIGFFLSTLFGARFADRVYKYLATKNGGKGTPEMRIPALIFGSLFVPVGLFWYGWSAQAKLHWVMPIIGSGIFGFGEWRSPHSSLPITLYLVDTFTYAASALAAATVFRSLLGFVFPLFGQQMFDALGFGGGTSLLGGLAIILGIPFPIYIYYYGEAIRMKSPLS
ncbi:major facilitator superfamily domain-containing protein, partial [Mycena capillaripes]